VGADLWALLGRPKASNEGAPRRGKRPRECQWAPTVLRPASEPIGRGRLSSSRRRAFAPEAARSRALRSDSAARGCACAARSRARPHSCARVNIQINIFLPCLFAPPPRQSTRRLNKMTTVRPFCACLPSWDEPLLNYNYKQPSVASQPFCLSLSLSSLPSELHLSAEERETLKESGPRISRTPVACPSAIDRAVLGPV